MKKKIYICYSGSPNFYDAHAVTGIAEDGLLDTIAGHLCSSELRVKHDMGMTSDRKHDIYNKAYPDGWELIWFGYIETDEDVERLKQIIMSDNE